MIDCATLFAGPLIATLMGDFGADVIKVEHPIGDPSAQHGREEGRPRALVEDCRAEQTLHRAGPETSDDAATFKALVRRRRRSGRKLPYWNARKLGSRWEQLSALNPRLVMVRVTGFGQTGPYARRAGFGTLAEAMSGFAHITGQPDGPPTLPPFGLADGIAAYFGCFATMFAIYDRDIRGTGKGQFIDLAIYEPIFALLGPQPIIFDQLGIIQNRTGNRSVNNAPRNAYRTRDNRWVALSAAAPSIVRRVLELTGGPEAADDPRFQTNLDRVAHVEEIDAIVGGWICKRDLSEVLDRIRRGRGGDRSGLRHRADFPRPAIRRARIDCNSRRPRSRAGSDAKRLPRLSRTPGSIRFAGPRIDQHRGEILDELRKARTEAREIGTNAPEGLSEEREA